MATSKRKISQISDDRRHDIINGVQEWCSCFEHWYTGHTRRQNIRYCFRKLRLWIKAGHTLRGALSLLDDDRFDFDQRQQVKEYGV